jgi:hypothetical protein
MDAIEDNSNNNNGQQLFSTCFGFCGIGDDDNNNNNNLIIPLRRPRNSNGNCPDDEPTKQVTDRMIAAELNRLSLEEREKVLNDIHGLPQPTEETPKFIQSCFDQFDAYLFAIKHNTAYELAESISPVYVGRDEFRLLFLRACRYDPHEAANKMLKFFQLKKDLWGVDKLCHDITLDDLDEDAIETLQSGCDGQVSPVRDMAGRPIVIFIMELRKTKIIKSVVSRLVLCFLRCIFVST